MLRISLANSHLQCVDWGKTFYTHFRCVKRQFSKINSLLASLINSFKWLRKEVEDASEGGFDEIKQQLEEVTKEGGNDQGEIEQEEDTNTHI